MEYNKSLDEFNVIAAMLCDANASHGVVFNTTALRLTTQKVAKRMQAEGVGFLTKTLLRLGKRLDQALTGEVVMTGSDIGFASGRGTKLPRFLGEFFATIFSNDGLLLPNPDASCVKIVRGLLLSFGKYKLPYSDDQEHDVVSAFEKAEADLTNLDDCFASWQNHLKDYNLRADGQVYYGAYPRTYVDRQGVRLPPALDIIREARKFLERVFLTFDPRDITPRHGPGSVATRQRNSGKYRWVNVSERITDLYPFDEYFCSSAGHVCDTYRSFNRVGKKSLPARVLLVPKDSRGPRLISCEPVDFQWIQGGLGAAIVRHVESHDLTKGFVNFTDQDVNRNKALTGSISGDSATLDLKEASDRIHTGLVRLLFPDTVFPYLECCRSSSTVLPNGKELTLKKYAPMGSALCFPVLSLTVWAILVGSTHNADIRKNIFVYGDDVIVPKDYSSSAMAALELFGLKINHNKSCCSGFFRESCGMDAFKGVDVTPVRFRTVWDKSPRPDTYTSWISYANSFYDRGFLSTYGVIRNMLESVFGPIPGEDMNLSCPSLRWSPSNSKHFRSRWNKNLQKFEYYVRDVSSPSHREDTVCGWQKLLRYFSEVPSRQYNDLTLRRPGKVDEVLTSTPFSVSQYTNRRASMLVRRWR